MFVGQNNFIQQYESVIQTVVMREACRPITLPSYMVNPSLRLFNQWNKYQWDIFHFHPWEAANHLGAGAIRCWVREINYLCWASPQSYTTQKIGSEESNHQIIVQIGCRRIFFFEFNRIYPSLVVYWITPLAAHTLNDNPLIFWYIFDKRGH